MSQCPSKPALNIGKLASGKAFTIPTDLVTRTQSILAIKGAGKTYTAIVQMEELLAAGLQCVALDPTGVWWGVRASADGQGPGLAVIILGGDHGDVPLDPAAGDIVADWVVDSGQSVVLDLSAFESNAAQDRFATAFAERLYRRKAATAARTPLHVFVDEADSFAPQRPQPGQQRMLGAWEAIVRRGRSRGLGLTLITQRPAVLNKNVLTQTELLTCLRIGGVQDRKAVEEWVNMHGDADRRRKMFEGLAALPRGTAWFWSPGWLGIFECVTVRARRTFDSSATPDTGRMPELPHELAPVDLAALGEKIRASADAIEANNPRRLRAQVAELQKQIATLQTRPTGLSEAEIYVRIQAAVKASLDERDQEWAKEIGTMRTNIRDALTELCDMVDNDDCRPPGIGRVVEPAGTPDSIATIVVDDDPRKPPRAPDFSGLRRLGRDAAEQVETRLAAALGSTVLNAYQRDLLAVLLDRSPVPTPRGQLGALAGRSIKSSAFGPNLRALVERGLVQRTGSGFVATEAAQAACSDHRPAPRSGRAALEFWLGKLPAYEASLLRTVSEAGARGVTIERLSDLSGKSLQSSAFRPALRNLLTLGHVERDGDHYILASVFAR